LEGYGDEWEEFVERLARDLAPALLRQLYGPYLERLRFLGSSSEKLVYLYLLLAQPQSFMTLRRGLEMAEKTLARVLSRLRERRYIIVDRYFLYRVTEPGDE